MKKKLFFYKIMASEMMSEVLQIPEGNHKKWVEDFVIDLVSANGRSEYTKKVIEDAETYRKAKVVAGRAGGKKRAAKARLKLEQAVLDGDEAVLDGDEAIRSRSNKEHILTKTEFNNKRTMYIDGKDIDVDTGEEVTPFG